MAKDVVQELQDELIKFRDERDWAQFHDPKNLSGALVIEAAELLEHFQWKTPGQVKEYSRRNKDKISSEVADVAIYLLILVRELKIDLPKAVKKKIKENAKRYPVEKAKGSAKKWNEL